MLVVLRQNWFAPDGRFYRKGFDGAPVQIPDELFRSLPKRAVPVAKSPEAEPEKVERLRDHDEGRQVAEANDVLLKKAEDFRVALEAEAATKRAKKG